MRGSSVVRVAVWACLALPLSAQAWEPINPSRPVWDGATAPYQINEVGSEDLGMATTITEVRRGMDDWTTPACSGLSTSYGGTTSRRPGTYEGESVIGWVESGWTNSSSAIGVTGTRYTSGSIIEADMEMNGVHFQWTTSPGSGSNVNVYSIALHEGGHYIGLGHSSSSSAAMYFAYSGGVSTMTADDEMGVCTLYPGGGGGTTDCSTTGCPTGQSCVSGACVDDTPPPGGGGGVCDPCTGHTSCGGGGDYCLTYPNGSGYCGSACTSDSDCGGDRCLTLSTGARQCVRFDGSDPSCTGGGTPPPTGSCSVDAECPTGQRCESGSCVAAGSGSTPLGGTCADHAECESGSCLAGVCTQSCEWPNGACPSGFYCDGEATGACGAGVCLAGAPGGGADGDHCSQDSDCANLYCFLGLCSQPCNPETVGSCPGGGVCQVGPLACRGACGTSGSLGDPCDGNDACASGLCAETDSGSFCTNLCDDSSPCPTGFRCSSGAVRVCEPDGGALGGQCEANEDCATGICAFEDTRNYCTRLCDPASPCPSSMACVDSGTAGIQVCQPTEEGSLPSNGRRMVGGCAISSSPHGGSGAWLLGLLGIALARRRFAHLSPRR